MMPAVQLDSAPVNPAAFGLVYGPRSPLGDTRRAASRIAASDATVLLTGETGTGKEVFARFIHASSARASRPFVPVNCGAIPENLLESELFGYVKGAFTGAMAPRRGRVAMAEGGTLFLDEIGELPLALQVKLLRLLQERTYEQVGSSDSQSANFRLVAATNRDLADEVKAGRFRSDLYYRLFVCPVRLPSLRERVGDVAVLFAHFWSRRGETRPVEPGVVRSLEAYAWPGNVRELENLVERVSVCAEGPVIRFADLPEEIRGPDIANTIKLGSVPHAEFAVDGDASISRELLPGDLTPPPQSFADLTPPPQRFDDLTPPPFMSGGFPGSASLTSPPLEETPMPVVAGVAVEVHAPVSGPGKPWLPMRVMLPIDLPTMLRELENAYIDAALAHTSSNKKEAARLLGMGRTTLVEKLRRRSVAGE